MSASMLVPAALIASTATGGLLVLYAFASFVARKNQHYFRNGLLAIVSAFVINSWWLAFIGMAIYKLYYLKEDT